ncbi:LexA family transcriptional regulator [Maritalea porphyrae]|uniref:LexA family transcriptional regulator n=1 Tax=Maritalea porphyrae TaxID=880732 RepID=UPI0022AEA193|nr:LexA family transcriptional regulator [Maritalea porphyrae]MCZ4270925.1 helix-turn-helix domain-containing protein [Maritalea porphyrae]
MKTSDVIRAILKVSGWNQSRLADHLGVTQPTVSRWMKGSEPNGAQFQAIQELYREVASTPSSSQQVSTDNGIPNLDIHAGLGNGGMGHIEVDPDTMRPLPQYTDGDWNMPPAFMSRFGNIKGVFAFVVTGDSMTPTIKGGSAVFVDTKQNYPSPPGLFVIDTGDGRLVKRVELIPRSEDIRIISDNKEYSTYEFNREDVHIFGRVIAVFSWNE